MSALIEAARAALLKIQRFALIDPPHMATLANIAMAADEGITALAAAEAQPTSCQHKRQKWAINMQSGSCSDCGAKFVFGRDGSPDVWSAPPAQPVGEPVAWRIKERINGEFDSEWNILSFEPPTTPRTIAIEALYTAPPAQPADPLTDEQIQALVLATVYDGDCSTPHRDAWAAEIGVPFARAIEAAHGIGEGA